MTPELEQYYRDRFDMFSSKGWKDLIEDINSMLVSTNTLDGIDTDSKLHFRKGEISILKWIIGIEQMSETAYKELQDESII